MNFRIVIKALTFGVIALSIVYLVAHTYTYTKTQVLYRKLLAESADVTPETRTPDQTTIPFNVYKYSQENLSVNLNDELEKKESKRGETRYESNSDDTSGTKKILVLKKLEYEEMGKESGSDSIDTVMNRTGVSNYEELFERVMFMKKTDLNFFQPVWKIKTNLSLLILKHTFISLHGDYEELYVVEQNDRKIYVYKSTKTDNAQNPYSLIDIDVHDKNTTYNILYVETGRTTTLSDDTVMRLIKSIQIE